MSGKTISNLSVGLFGDVSNFADAFGRKAVTATEKFAGSMKAMGSSAGGIGGKLAGMAKGFGAGAIIGAGAAIGSGLMEGIGDAFKKGFSDLANFQSAQVALQTMLGSAKDGRDVLLQLREFSTHNGLNFDNLAVSAKNFAAMGVSAGNIVPTIAMLQNVASGTGKPLEIISELYTRMRSDGGISNRELLEFANNGVPIVAALAKVMGTSEQNTRAMIAAGKVGFPQVQKAFISMTSAGGEFADLTEKQGHTLGGLWTSLTATIGDAFEDIAEGLDSKLNLSGGLAKIRDLVSIFTDSGKAVGFLNEKLGQYRGIMYGVEYLGMEAFDAIKRSVYSAYLLIKPVADWIVAVIEEAHNQLRNLLKYLETVSERIPWVKEKMNGLGKDAESDLKIKAPTIEPPKPMKLELKPHVGGDGLVKWGSAESQRLNYMLGHATSGAENNVAAVAAASAATVAKAVVAAVKRIKTPWESIDTKATLVQRMKNDLIGTDKRIAFARWDVQAPFAAWKNDLMKLQDNPERSRLLAIANQKESQALKLFDASKWVKSLHADSERRTGKMYDYYMAHQKQIEAQARLDAKQAQIVVQNANWNQHRSIASGTDTANKNDPKGPGTNNDYLKQIWQDSKPGNVAVANF